MAGRTQAKAKDPRQTRRALGILSVLAVIVLYILRVTGAVDYDPYDPMPETWITVQFTAPERAGDAVEPLHRLDERLIADIDAAYDFDLETVAQALVAAHDRGVRVRFVTDTDTVGEPAVSRLAEAEIPVVEDQRGAIMHDKFVVVDRAILWTGSWNLTRNGTTRNDNNAVRIVLAALAQNYEVEFEEMFVDRAFGPTSPADTPHPQLSFTPPGGRESVHFETYFAPEDQVADQILALVGGAQQSIRFLAYSFTDDRLGEAILAQAHAGRVVQGVLETRGADTPYSEYQRLSRARPLVDVRLDGNPYLMHHKVLILDSEIVIVGSYNFTESANEANDENVLVIHDTEVAALYEAEFERIYDLSTAE
jgi:phosphatidylserine/phosphatidylglycerophosphate/cardiolipin synthase-like enzyme